MLFQLKKLPEIINLTPFLKSFWILYIDQIIVYNAFYSKLTFYIIKDRCQMHTLKVFRSPVWLLLHKLSSPHYHYIRKMRRGDRLPLTQMLGWYYCNGTIFKMVPVYFHSSTDDYSSLHWLILLKFWHILRIDEITILFFFMIFILFYSCLFWITGICLPKKDIF